MKNPIYNPMDIEVILKMWYCKTCKKDKNINTKSSQTKSNLHIEIEVVSRVDNDLTGKKSTSFNPVFDQGDLERKAIDCVQHFYRFKY